MTNLASWMSFLLCSISLETFDDTFSLSGYVNTCPGFWLCSMSSSVSFRQKIFISPQCIGLHFPSCRPSFPRNTCMLPAVQSPEKANHHMKAESCSKWWQPHIRRFMGDFSYVQTKLIGSLTPTRTSNTRNFFKMNSNREKDPWRAEWVMVFLSQGK